MKVAALTGCCFASGRGWVAHCHVCRLSWVGCATLAEAAAMLHNHRLDADHRGNGSGNDRAPTATPWPVLAAAETPMAPSVSD